MDWRDAFSGALDDVLGGALGSDRAWSPERAEAWLRGFLAAHRTGARADQIVEALEWSGELEQKGEVVRALKAGVRAGWICRLDVKPSLYRLG